VQDLSYALRIDARPMIDRMQRNNQKKLRKCQREGFVVAKAETPKDQWDAYEAVAVNRRSRGYQISMTYEQLEDLAQRFPGRVHYFFVKHRANVIAGAVCIAVSRQVLYVFYWGDIPGYEIFSPVVMLAQAIHDFAKDAGFSVLDVGRSTDDSVPNVGLIRFKEKLGFEASLKLTFKKQL
jgi:predicted N-acyltransferase